LASEAGLSSIEGRFDADASLAATGQSPAELIAGLSGEATLRGHDGAVTGIDLAAANEWLKVLDRPFDLLGLIRSGLGGRTSVRELTGSFHAADGIVRSDDLRLTADGTAGQGAATFDLPRWTMTSRLEFRLTGLPMAPPLGVQLDGPIDAPREVFDVNPLQRFLKQRQHTAGDQPVSGAAPER
jgi:AsmA protein